MHHHAQSKRGKYTRNVKDQRSISEVKDQPWLEEVADSGPSYMVEVLMDDGRVIAENIEQIGGITMQGPASDGQHDQGVVTESIMLVKTDGPVTHLDPPYGNEALEDEGSGLNTGETGSGHAVMKGGTRATVMITKMHGNISKGYHGLLIYNGRDFDPKWGRSLC